MHILFESNDLIFICTENLMETWKFKTVVRYPLHPPFLKKDDKLSGSGRTKDNGLACRVHCERVNMCEGLVEDKDIFKAVFVQTHLHACLLSEGITISLALERGG